jgi:aminopeptidase-like protein
MTTPKMAVNLNTTGDEMHRLISELYPICRSITGNGVRQTLRLINEYIQLSMQEVPTGTRVFDWVVPKEWNISDGYVKNSRGEKIINFQKSNLHVVGYSIPIHQKMSLEELRPHLFTLPEYPDWIPYRNSYYTEDWGFCLSHRQFLELENDVYEVFIDSSLEDGHLTYGEYYLEGNIKDEVLISCHICHPSLCNDNLSGIAVAVFLARHLRSILRRHSYRFLFLPTTIGSITWLALNENELSSIKHGLVLACLGDSGASTYKKSRLGNTVIDRAAVNVLKHSGQNYEIMDFLPYGYDERQFCSPGFNLPVGCFMRTPNGCFPQYHTSADDLNFVQPDALYDSFLKCTKILNILDKDGIYMNQNPKCEPQLGKRGLYRPLGQQHQLPSDQLAILWVLNLSDGNHSLLDIAERAGMSFEEIRRAAGMLDASGLILKVNGQAEEKRE